MAVFTTTWGPDNSLAKAHTNVNRYRGNSFIAGGVRLENKTLVLAATNDVNVMNHLANFGSDDGSLGKKVSALPTSKCVQQRMRSQDQGD